MNKSLYLEHCNFIIIIALNEYFHGLIWFHSYLKASWRVMKSLISIFVMDLIDQRRCSTDIVCFRFLAFGAHTESCSNSNFILHSWFIRFWMCGFAVFGRHHSNSYNWAGFHFGLRISERCFLEIYFIFDWDLYFEIYYLHLRCNFFEDWDHCNQISDFHYLIDYFYSYHFHCTIH